MATELWADNPTATQQGNGGSISSSATSMLVNVTSTNWPRPSPGTLFRIAWNDGTDEIATVSAGVTATAGTQTWTIQRGAEGTAVSHNDGTSIYQVVTAATMANLQQKMVGTQIGQIAVWNGSAWELRSAPTPLVEALGSQVSGTQYEYGATAPAVGHSLPESWSGLFFAYPDSYGSADTTPHGYYQFGWNSASNPSHTAWVDAYVPWLRDSNGLTCSTVTANRTLDGQPSKTIPTGGITTNGTTWTVQTSTAHGFSAASVVAIAGVTPAGYNGTFSVASVVDSTHFTITNATQPGVVTVAGTVGFTYGANVDWWLRNHPDWLLYTAAQTGIAGDNIPDPFSYKNSAGRIATIDYTNTSFLAWAATNWWPALLGQFDGIFFDNGTVSQYATQSGANFQAYRLAAGKTYAGAVSGDYTAAWGNAAVDHTYAANQLAALQSIYATCKGIDPTCTITVNQGYDGASALDVSDYRKIFQDGPDMLLTEYGFTHGGAGTIQSSYQYGGWQTDTNNTQATLAFKNILDAYIQVQKVYGKGLALVQAVPLAGSSFTVTGGSWLSGTATLTFASHTMSTGQYVTVSGITVTGGSGGSYNGTFRITGTTGTTITYAVATDPGTWSSGGTVLNGTIYNDLKGTASWTGSSNIPANWTSTGGETAATLANRKCYTEWLLATYLLAKYHHTYLWIGTKQGYGFATANQAEFATLARLGRPLDDYKLLDTTVGTFSGTAQSYGTGISTLRLYGRAYERGYVLAFADIGVFTGTGQSNSVTVDVTQIGPTPGHYTDLWGAAYTSTITLTAPGNNPGGTWLRCAAILLSA